MDDLLFGAVADQATLDPVLAVLEYLRDRRANRPGMVLFGLHTLGILGAGLVRGGRRVDFVHSSWGMVMTPQTNNLVKSVDFFERAREAFGVRKPVPFQLIAHWRRSRAPWLERNPLLAMRIVSQRGSYFASNALTWLRGSVPAAPIWIGERLLRGDASKAPALRRKYAPGRLDTAIGIE